MGTACEALTCITWGVGPNNLAGLATRASAYIRRRCPSYTSPLLDPRGSIGVSGSAQQSFSHFTIKVLLWVAISTANVTEPGSFGTSKPAFLEASIVRVLKLFILMLLQPWRTKDFSHPERSISFRQVRNLEICWKCGFHYILVLDSKIQSFFILPSSQWVLWRRRCTSTPKTCSSL